MHFFILSFWEVHKWYRKFENVLQFSQEWCPKGLDRTGGIHKWFLIIVSVIHLFHTRGFAIQVISPDMSIFKILIILGPFGNIAYTLLTACDKQLYLLQRLR